MITRKRASTQSLRESDEPRKRLELIDDRDIGIVMESPHPLQTTLKSGSDAAHSRNQQLQKRYNHVDSPSKPVEATIKLHQKDGEQPPLLSARKSDIWIDEDIRPSEVKNYIQANRAKRLQRTRGWVTKDIKEILKGFCCKCEKRQEISSVNGHCLTCEHTRNCWGCLTQLSKYAVLSRR